MAERDSSTMEGHNSSCRNAINPTSSVVTHKMCTLLTFVRGLLQHGLPYSCLMTVLSFVSISIHHHHTDQQDGKVIPVLVRLQTCLLTYNFFPKLHFLMQFSMCYYGSARIFYSNLKNCQLSFIVHNNVN